MIITFGFPIRLIRLFRLNVLRGCFFKLTTLVRALSYSTDEFVYYYEHACFSLFLSNTTPTKSIRGFPNKT